MARPLLLAALAAAAARAARPEYQWHPILRSIRGTYITTAAASGEVCSSSVFAKLSDEDINAISDGSGTHLYRFTSLSAAKNTPLHVRTEYDYNDTAFGLGWWKHEVCLGSRIELCTWLPVSQWLQLNTAFAAGVDDPTDEGCEGWAIARNRHGCVKGKVCEARTYEAGAGCTRSDREDIIIYKYGASSRPASRAMAVGYRCAENPPFGSPLWSGVEPRCLERCAATAWCGFFTTYANGTCVLSRSCGRMAPESPDVVARTYQLLDWQALLTTTMTSTSTSQTTTSECAAPPCGQSTSSAEGRAEEEKEEEEPKTTMATKIVLGALGVAALLGCAIGIVLNCRSSRASIDATNSVPYQEEPDFTWTASSRSARRPPWYDADAATPPQASPSAATLGAPAPRLGPPGGASAPGLAHTTTSSSQKWRPPAAFRSDFRREQKRPSGDTE